MSKYYYVTVASGSAFIKDYTQYAVKSLLKAGVDSSDIHVALNTKSDYKMFQKLVPQISNLYLVNEDLSIAKWQKFGGKRRYSLLKAAALYKVFGKPKEGKTLVYFDGDVLWYKNPEPFLDKHSDKTWFHHGKCLEKRAKIKKNKVDISSVNSLSKWCSLPMAHLIVKWGGKVLPTREVVAGFYILHPKDHEAVLKKTYEGCIENSDKFGRHEGCGDQKPMNAALTVLGIDWEGGSRFFCPDHEQYFDHFFGKNDLKTVFHKRAKKMGLK